MSKKRHVKPVPTRHLATANRPRVSCAHNTSRASPWPWNLWLEVTQRHWKWHRSIDRIRVPTITATIQKVYLKGLWPGWLQYAPRLLVNSRPNALCYL